MSTPRPLHLFEAYGVELEYMIVDADSLSVRPLADVVLRDEAGAVASDVERGAIGWSNELALHVIELKTNGPTAALEPLPAQFLRNIAEVNALLAAHGARLMPTAMHPWMDPHRELRLWPHDNNTVYETFNRIFDCRGHGWANLQSVHLNLPFADDNEFGRLHAAIRLMLPILPALAASSPIMEHRITHLADTRLDVYRQNSARIPSVSGAVIPEPVFTRQAYEQVILQRMYADIAPHDPAGVLQHEWLNARGAIARFDRNTIEIRVIDVQECPQADLAVCMAISEVLRALVEERWTDVREQQAFPNAALEAILLDSIRDGEQALINHPAYLAQFGFPYSADCTANDLWQHLLDSLGFFHGRLEAWWGEPLRVMLHRGTLARRIVKALGDDPSPARIGRVYRELCECLAQGRMFRGCD